MPKTQSPHPPQRIEPIFLRLPDVTAVLGLGRSTVYALLKTDPDFPRPVNLGSRAVAWRRSEIEEWAATRPAAEHA